jgi:hypothetical protein
MSHKKILYFTASSLLAVCMGLLIGCNTHTESNVTHEIEASFTSSLSNEDIAKIKETCDWGIVSNVSVCSQHNNCYNITFTPHPIKLDKNLFDALKNSSLSNACNKTVAKALPLNKAAITRIAWKGSPSQQEIREAAFARRERVRQRRAERHHNFSNSQNPPSLRVIALAGRAQRHAFWRFKAGHLNKYSIIK